MSASDNSVLCWTTSEGWWAAVGAPFPVTFFLVGKSCNLCSPARLFMPGLNSKCDLNATVYFLMLRTVTTQHANPRLIPLVILRACRVLDWWHTDAGLRIIRNDAHFLLHLKILLCLIMRKLWGRMWSGKWNYRLECRARIQQLSYIVVSCSPPSVCRLVCVGPLFLPVRFCAI